MKMEIEIKVCIHYMIQDHAHIHYYSTYSMTDLDQLDDRYNVL